MPLPLPHLDDRTYEQILEDGRSLLTRIIPDWSDHNPSDPGIALLELLAWLTEGLIYRTNQVSRSQFLGFLKLLNGPTWNSTNDNMVESLRATLTELSQPARAVTANDYESLLRDQWPKSNEARSLEGAVASVRLQQARCLSGLCPSTPSDGSLEAKLGHVTVVVDPVVAHREVNDLDSEAVKEIRAAVAKILEGLAAFLEERSLLGTTVHVMQPTKVRGKLKVSLVWSGASSTTTNFQNTIRERLQVWIASLALGRNVYRSELIQVVDSVAGVACVAVEDTTIELVDAVNSTSRLIVHETANSSTVVGLRLLPHEQLTVAPEHIEIREIPRTA